MADRNVMPGNSYDEAVERIVDALAAGNGAVLARAALSGPARIAGSHGTAR